MIIQGDRVTLRPIQPSDFPKLVEWSHDPEVNQYLEGNYPSDLSECPSWHQQLQSDRHNQRYAIVADDGTFIGDIELDHITWRSGDAELRIRIGQKEYWDRGYGTDSVRTLLEHAFYKMKLTRVYLRVFRFNKRAVRCYEKSGFKPEGRMTRRGADGTEHEILLMRITAAEYERRRHKTNHRQPVASGGMGHVS